MRLGRSAGPDTGRRRRRNEDAFVLRPPLFAIADGMGGAQAGEVASRLAAAVLNESDGVGAGEARVSELIQEANRRVFQRSNEDASTQGMGTTMTWRSWTRPPGRSRSATWATRARTACGTAISSS